MGRIPVVVMLLWSSAALADPRRSETFIAGKAGKLQAFVWRPSGAGPFPALVYNHGSERDPVIGTESAIGPYFADNGWVVIFPIRRGAGRSEGAYWGERVRRQPAAEKDRAVVDALVTDADDVAAAVDWLRAQKFVDHDNISVAGCSFGGIESLLSAERPLRLRAVIDFAGASLSWAGNAPLRERMTQAAQHAQAPVFFLQAENDFDTTPSRALAATMKERHLPHRLHIFPPHGVTPMGGHAGFCNQGTAEWGPEVLDFLRQPTAARQKMTP